MLILEQNFISLSKVCNRETIILHLNFAFLQGVYRGSYLGDMAIDDVLVTPNAQCEIPTTTTTTPSTTSVGQHTPLSCNFETDACLWINDTSASGYWKRRQGSPSDISVGPHYGNIQVEFCSTNSLFYLDHTLQSADGYFIDTSDLKVNQTARLISTITSIQQQGICFRFWYRVYGSKQGQLNVLQQLFGSNNRTLIYTVRPNLDIDWREAMVYRNTFGNYQFLLEAVAGDILVDSDNIAVDDLTTSEGRVLIVENDERGTMIDVQ